MNSKSKKTMSKVSDLLFNWTRITIGAIIIALGIELFLVPNQLSTGGFSGISTIIYYMTGMPVGTAMLLLNIPIFLLAFFKVGKKFFVNALLGTTLLSLFLNAFQKLQPLTDDRFLAFIYGSIIVGIGTALVLKSNGSTRWFRYGCLYNKSI